MLLTLGKGTSPRQTSTPFTPPLEAPTIPLFASVKDNTANFKILAIGDSTTAGVGSTAKFRNNGPTEKLRALIEAEGYEASSDSFIGWGAPQTNNVNERVLDHDDRLTWSGSINKNGTGNALGHGLFQFSSSGQLSFSPDKDVDTFILYCAKNIVSGNNVVYNIDGGSNTTHSLYFNNSRTYETILISANNIGQHTLNISTTGGFFLHGIEAYDSTKKHVSLINAGAPSMKGASYYYTGSNTPWTTGEVIAYINPDVLKINFGINDINQGETKSSFKAAMQTMITGYQTDFPNTAIWLEVPNDISTAATSANKAGIYEAIGELASENSLPLIDLRDSLGTYAQATASGYMNDTLHPSAAGYDMIAQAVSDKIKTL